MNTTKKRKKYYMLRKDEKYRFCYFTLGFTKAERTWCINFGLNLFGNARNWTFGRFYYGEEHKEERKIKWYFRKIHYTPSNTFPKS